MKLTRKDILQYDGLLTSIEKQIPHAELKPFKYAFLKNRLKFKVFTKERDEFIQLLLEPWKEIATDPTDSVEFQAYVEVSEDFKRFLAEELEFEFYTIDAEKLESEQDYSLDVAEALLGTIIIEK